MGTILNNALAGLGAQASKIRARRGQMIAVSPDGACTVFIVRSGVLTLQVQFPGTPRQVVTILFPGDVLRSEAVPPGANAALTAASAAEVWRLRWPVLEGFMAGDPGLSRLVNNALATQMARQAIHLAAVGQFNGEQRVATFLTELGLRTGTPAAGGAVTFDMPLVRRDIADYLGLNADTLSRIMSRLRQSGIFSPYDRMRAVVPDWNALISLSPAAVSLTELHAAQLADRKPAVRD